MDPLDRNLDRLRTVVERQFTRRRLLHMPRRLTMLDIPSLPYTTGQGVELETLSPDQGVPPKSPTTLAPPSAAAGSPLSEQLRPAETGSLLEHIARLFRGIGRESR